MKFNKAIILSAVSLLTFTSCEDFLDSQDYVNKNSDNFPGTQQDVERMVAAVYKSSFYAPFGDNTLSQYFSISNLFSDDMFGGAGEGAGDKQWQAMGHLMYEEDNYLNQLWKAAYEAIARANSALSAIDNISDETLRAQTKGELLFHRAYNYYNLVQTFNNVPFIESAPSDVAGAQVAPTQLTGKEIFTHIARDLYDAVECMPTSDEYKWTQGWNKKLKYGQVSTWAARTLLARAWLFYTGFYGESSMPMFKEASDSDVPAAIEKNYVIDALALLVDPAKSGHQLLEDYRMLWPYANEYTAKDYDFVKDLDEAKKTYKEGNSEVILAINFQYQAEWTASLHLTNQYALFFGVRADLNEPEDTRYYLPGVGPNTGQPSIYPFGGGWGIGPVNPGLYDSFEEGDVRRDASINDIRNLGFDPNTFSNGLELTLLHQKKFIATRSNGGDKYSWSAAANDAKGHGNYQASHTQALTVYRLADAYLMYSELTGDATKMNEVRKRAGLEPVAYSLDALKNERRHELAFEGVRWDDLRRWGNAGDVLEDQETGNYEIYNCGVKGVYPKIKEGIKARYEKTKGYYRIPQEQINLSGYKQNAGWEDGDGRYVRPAY